MWTSLPIRFGWLTTFWAGSYVGTAAEGIPQPDTSGDHEDHDHDRNDPAECHPATAQHAISTADSIAIHHAKSIVHSVAIVYPTITAVHEYARNIEQYNHDQNNADDPKEGIFLHEIFPFLFSLSE